MVHWNRVILRAQLSKNCRWTCLGIYGAETHFAMCYIDVYVTYTDLCTPGWTDIALWKRTQVLIFLCSGLGEGLGAPFLVQTCVPVIDHTSEPLSGTPAWFYMACLKGDKTKRVDLELWVSRGDFCACLFLAYAMTDRLLFSWDAFKCTVSDVPMSWNLFLQQMFQQIVSLLPPLQQVFLTE